MLALVSAAAFVAACANQAKLREAELSELASWIAGQWQYDGSEQALALVIAPIYAPALGKHAFYVQEMAADDPRRVMAQRVIAFDVDANGRIVQGTYSLAEPIRWRDAHLNPDLFKGLIPSQDVRPAGCELVWTRESASFVAANDPARCRAPARAELTPDQLSLQERADQPPHRYGRR